MCNILIDFRKYSQNGTGTVNDVSKISLGHPKPQSDHAAHVSRGNKPRAGHPKGIGQRKRQRQRLRQRLCRVDHFKIGGNPSHHPFADGIFINNPLGGTAMTMDTSICFRSLAQDDRNWCPKPGRFSNVGSRMMQRHRGCEFLN